MKLWNVCFLAIIVSACRKSGALDRDGDGASSSSDCNDADPDIRPGATEVCDDADNDCDGDVDEGVLETFHVDADRDGYGGATTVDACEPGPGVVDDAEDCDDSDATVRPGAPELCNGRDDNCDGTEDTELTWYIDADGDGYGDLIAGVDACDEPEGFVADGTDCDDGDPQVHPGAAELCNGYDDDCDGLDRACRFDGDYDLADATTVLTSDEFNQGSGSRVVAGDVTADGVDDLVVVTAPYGSNGTGVWIAAGPIEGEAPFEDSAIRILASDALQDVGGSISLGDADGDGNTDVALDASGSALRDGGLFVVFGPVTADLGLPANADATLTEAENGFGAGSVLGDVDGDGIADAIIASDRDGAVYVELGPLSGPTHLYSSADFEISAEVDGGGLGEQMRAGDDIDGDGIGDLVVAAPRDETEAGGAGCVYVVLGPIAIDSSFEDASGTYWGPDEGSQAGRTIDTGDVDGDGRVDVIAQSRAPEGVVSVVLGPADATTTLDHADIVLHSDETWYRLGDGLGSGDIDGDGVEELLVGAPWNDGAGADSTGLVYLLYDLPLGTSLVENAAQTTFRGDEGLDQAGQSVAVGDLDDSGFGDVIIGAPGLGEGGGVYVAYADSL